MERFVLVWDCGSTNLRVVALDEKGEILARLSEPNDTVSQSDAQPSWKVWDIEDIWQKLSRLTSAVLEEIGTDGLVALTITSWGADGTVVARDGSLLYPLISWQCPRTEPYIEKIKSIIPPEELFIRTGYQLISFNTIFKLMWLKDYVPELLDEGKFLMTPGILSMKLTGVMSIDPTMAGTSMVMSLKGRDWEEEILCKVGISPSVFPHWVEPGEVIGSVTEQAYEATGIPVGTPVVAGGHDTQFAIYGSGARSDEAILSSGTWEIVLVRVNNFEPEAGVAGTGIIIEQDAVRGYLDPQFLMMGSAVLEWTREHLYRSSTYERMIAEAEDARTDSLFFIPTFVPTAGPASPFGTPGSIVGLELSTTPAQLYRAGLEGLSFQLRHALEVFRDAVGFEPAGVRVVGGGSKNPLWNRLRAEITNLPISITEHKEATVLGASLFAFVGAGVYSSIDQAQSAIDVGVSTIEPSQPAKYEDAYCRYLKLVRALGASR